MAYQLPAPGDRLGDTIRRRFEQDETIWLTTVGKDGTPQPNPVWFIWEDGTILTYNRVDAARVAHVQARPRVALNFDTDGSGGSIQVITGDAAIDEAALASPDNAAFQAKYGAPILRIGYTVQSFAERYPVAIRIRPTSARGF